MLKVDLVIRIFESVFKPKKTTYCKEHKAFKNIFYFQAMGYDLALFCDGEIDEELVCPICKGVLEGAMCAPNCEHAFCTDCIKEWLSQHQTCPLDRTALEFSQMKSVPRILKNLLGKLRYLVVIFIST